MHAGGRAGQDNGRASPETGNAFKNIISSRANRLGWAGRIIRIFADGVLKYYGDKSLHQQSHGESFLALLGHRLFGHGLYIFDEPEAALSPSRQMYMLCRMKQLAEQGSQFIISTHSPIVMSYPGAEIYEITDRGLEPTELEETSHFQLMKRFILDRRGILRH